VRENSLGAAVARGFGKLVLGRGFVMGLQFVTLAVLAAYLEPSGLGVYTFGLAAAGLFRLLTNFGLVPVLTREVAQRPEREPELVPNVMYMRALLGVAAYGLLALCMLVVDFGDANARAALIAGLVLLVVLDVFRSSLEVRLRVGWISLADAAEAAATLVGALLLARADAGVESFLWLYVLLKLMNATVLLLVAARLVRFRWRLHTALWRPLAVAAVPLGVAGVLMVLYYRIDIILLGWLKPASDVGQYGAAYRFVDSFTVLPAMVMTVLSPVFSRSFVEGAQSLQRRFTETIHLMSIAALYVGVVGAAVAWRVLPELPGFDRYEGGAVALSIMCPAAALILLGTVTQGTLISAHLQGRLLRISALGLVLNLLLNAALIPPYSYIGAAVATTTTEVFLFLLSVREAHKRLGLRWDAGRLGRLGLLAVLLGALLALGLLVNPFLQLAAGTAAFAALLSPLGVLRPDELRRLLRREREEAAPAAPESP
jgi:O-antigen/teichoic acid export membrane protein